MTEILRLGVLISGGGTNLQAIIDASQRPDYPAQVVVVASNNPGASGLERAKEASIPTVCVSHKGYKFREAHEKEIIEQMAPYNVQALALAGYMRVVTSCLIGEFFDADNNLPGIINIHPADTGQYQGAHGYEFALGLLADHPTRLKETKITVHFIDAGVDTGPIIKQATVPISESDTIDDLKQRGLKVEHDLYPEVIELYARGRISLNENKQVVISPKA